MIVEMKRGQVSETVDVPCVRRLIWPSDRVPSELARRIGGQNSQSLASLTGPGAGLHSNRSSLQACARTSPFPLRPLRREVLVAKFGLSLSLEIPLSPL